MYFACFIDSFFHTIVPATLFTELCSGCVIWPTGQIPILPYHILPVPVSKWGLVTAHVVAIPTSNNKQEQKPHQSNKSRTSNKGIEPNVLYEKRELNNQSEMI